MTTLTCCQGKNAPRASRYYINSSSSYHKRTYKLWSQECPKIIKSIRFIPAPATMRELTFCKAKNGPRASRLSDSFQLQPLWGNWRSIKPRMPQEHQACQIDYSFSHYERTYNLSNQEYHKSIKTVKFIPAPGIIRELTNCEAKNAQRASWLSDPFQFQPPWENLHPVKPRMPQEHQHCQIHSSSSHHERTYFLSSQECHKSNKPVRFIPAAVTMTELTSCQAKNAPPASRPSDSFQFQSPWENLHSVKPRMPQEHQDCQIHSSSSHHERTYPLSSQECPKSINTVRFIPAPAIMRELTFCQAKNATRASKLSDLFQLQPP